MLSLRYSLPYLPQAKESTKLFSKIRPNNVVFADMEELGLKPNIAIVHMVGKVFLKLGMKDKYEKLVKKYPPPQWGFRYIKGRRVKVKAKQLNELSEVEGGFSHDEDNIGDEIESKI